MKLQYPARLSYLYDILKDIDNFAESKKFSYKKRQQIRLIAEELIVNIMNYAYNTDEGLINVDLHSEDNKKILLTITDTGKKFNPLLTESPDINEDFNQRTPGGLGIFMVKELADNAEYEYVNNQNILKIFITDD